MNSKEPRKKKLCNTLIFARDIFLNPTVTLTFLLVLCIVIADVTGISTEASADRKVPIYSVDRSDKVIALTIDAAWGNEYTDEIISILDKYGVKITFFTTDFWANDHPDDIRKLALAGHEIANHSLTHPDMTNLSEAEIENELLTTWQTQTSLAGSSAVRLFRAPYGSYNNTLLEVCERNGFACIQWSTDSVDWKDGATPQTVIDRVLKNTKSGSIILMHNNSKVITRVLPTVIESLLKDGYTFTTVSQLIYKGSATVDSNGIQHGVE